MTDEWSGPTHTPTIRTQEHYDPIVAPEARLYPVTEAVTHDNDGGAAGSNAGEGARVAVVELDYRKELKRCVCFLQLGIYNGLTSLIEPCYLTSHRKQTEMTGSTAS